MIDTDECKPVYVVRYFVKYEGHYFVGVFDDDVRMDDTIFELKKIHKDGEFRVERVEMNVGEVRFF
jgi:hypothetical protein